MASCSWSVVASVVIGAACVSGSASASTPANDTACESAYNGGFGANLGPLNGGTGFGDWAFAFFTTSGPTFSGVFAAQPGGNVDLNNVRCTGGAGPGRAWGFFANSNQPDNALAIASAVRPFTGGPLSVGQTVRVLFEHSGVRSGNFNPQNGPDVGGWVGFTLRSGGEGAPLDPIPFLNGINGSMGFGFRGGGTEYQLHDTITPSGRNSGVGFTFDGLDVAVTLRPSNAYVIRIQNLGTSAVTYATGQASSTNLNQLMLSNRNSQQGDVFFNTISVTSGCLGDYNTDGQRTPTDIFAYLNSYFAGEIRADWDGNRLLQPADIFGFLNAYFAGCA